MEKDYLVLKRASTTGPPASGTKMILMCYLKFKNPAAKREAEEDWGKGRWR
jgi:hypothetical protein